MRFPCPPFRAFNKHGSLGSGRNFVLILRGTKSPNSRGSRGEWNFLLDGAPEELHEEEEEEEGALGTGMLRGTNRAAICPGQPTWGRARPQGDTCGFTSDAHGAGQPHGFPEASSGCPRRSEAGREAGLCPGDAFGDRPQPQMFP